MGTLDKTNGMHNAASCYKEAVQFSAFFVSSLFACFWQNLWNGNRFYIFIARVCHMTGQLQTAVINWTYYSCNGIRQVWLEIEIFKEWLDSGFAGAAIRFSPVWFSKYEKSKIYVLLGIYSWIAAVFYYNDVTVTSVRTLNMDTLWLKVSHKEQCPCLVPCLEGEGGGISRADVSVPLLHRNMGAGFVELSHHSLLMLITDITV